MAFSICVHVCVRICHTQMLTPAPAQPTCASHVHISASATRFLSPSHTSRCWYSQGCQPHQHDTLLIVLWDLGHSAHIIILYTAICKGRHDPHDCDYWTAHIYWPNIKLYTGLTAHKASVSPLWIINWNINTASCCSTEIEMTVKIRLLQALNKITHSVWFCNIAW